MSRRRVDWAYVCLDHTILGTKCVELHIVHHKHDDRWVGICAWFWRKYSGNWSTPRNEPNPGEDLERVLKVT